MLRLSHTQYDQPAGKVEEFFREVGNYDGNPAFHEALGIDGMHRFFDAHGIDLLDRRWAGMKAENSAHLRQKCPPRAVFRTRKAVDGAVKK